jgi:alcohol dehydrogenase (cytochrome c)
LGHKLAILSVLIMSAALALGGFSATVDGATSSNASSNSSSATAAAAGGGGAGSSQNPYSNWPASSYDFQNTNNSPQNVINANNVGNLKLRWFFQIPVNQFNIPGAPPALGIETQPIIYQGVVYIATPYNDIIALSASTGAQLWSYAINMTKWIGDKWWAGAYVISGLSLYNGTLYAMASDTTVYAFNALSGNIEFTIPAIAQNITGNTGTYYGEKAPILVGDNLIVRASTTDYGGRGFVAAYNIITLNRTWIWYSVPPAGGDPTWDSSQCQSPCHGNITPYPGDWGNNTLMGGAAAWGLIAVDNKTNTIYFSTGHPANPYNATLRPGPNLFSDCVVALNATSGKMLWYYQINSHDITEHEGGWSVSLSNVTINKVVTPVVVQAAKNNYIYVLNAQNGTPVYAPIHVGPPGRNNLNDGKTTTADLTANQAALGNNQEICPGPDGGIEMAPAVDGNMLYVATQNACGQMSQGPYTYKGLTLQAGSQYGAGYIYTGDPNAPQNATVYAIDLSTGTPVWHYNLPNRYQGSSAVVSGGVVYTIDRAGNMYELDAATGKLLGTYDLGGVGAAGVAIAEDSAGNMMIFAPSGGGSLPNATPGVLTAFWLGTPTSTQTGTDTNSSATGPNISQLEEPIIVALAVIVVVLVMFILLRRRTPAQGTA